jgi:hypothetical protein
MPRFQNLSSNKYLLSNVFSIWHFCYSSLSWQRHITAAKALQKHRERFLIRSLTLCFQRGKHMVLFTGQSRDAIVTKKKTEPQKQTSLLSLSFLSQQCVLWFDEMRFLLTVRLTTMNKGLLEKLPRSVESREKAVLPFFRKLTF